MLAEAAATLLERRGMRAGTLLQVCVADEGKEEFTLTLVKEKFADGDFCAAVRMRLCQKVSPPGLRCSNTHLSESRTGGACAESLDTKGTHASICKVGGGVGRKHDALVRLLGRLLRAAGYTVATDGPGTWEPHWDRPVRDQQGEQRRDAQGDLLWERGHLAISPETCPK